MAELNSIIAERYVSETVKGSRVGSAFIFTDEYTDCLVYRVPFTLPEYGDCAMDVWQEPDGSIYGEW